MLLATNGLAVESWDKKLEGLEATKRYAEEAGLSVTTQEVDLHTARLDRDFDVIISTVTLQFLEPHAAQELWQSVVDHTRVGGYNVLIAPIASDDIGCPIAFSHLAPYDWYTRFYENEHWEIIEANNMVGHFHRVDEKGNRIRSRFATIIAKRISA